MDLLYKNGKNGANYKKRIDNATEKFHKDAEKLREKGIGFSIIDWETFRIHYMRDSEPEGEYERYKYIQSRSNLWKDDINSKFCELGYSEWLFVEYDKGIRLETDVTAFRKMQLKMLKKECSITERQTKRLLGFSECFTGRNKKEMITFAEMVGLNKLTFIAGQITLNKSLPKKQKAELLSIIEEYVPEDEE